MVTPNSVAPFICDQDVTSAQTPPLPAEVKQVLKCYSTLVKREGLGDQETKATAASVGNPGVSLSANTG